MWSHWRHLLYAPQPCRYGRLRGLGHPHLAAFFWYLLPLGPVPDNADLVVYKTRPNLVSELCLPAELHLPWSRLVVKRFGWRGRQPYWCSPQWVVHLYGRCNAGGDVSCTGPIRSVSGSD